MTDFFFTIRDGVVSTDSPILDKGEWTHVTIDLPSKIRTVVHRDKIIDGKVLVGHDIYEDGGLVETHFISAEKVRV